MLEIAKCVNEPESKIYQDAALKMLHTLEKKRCNWSEDCDNLVEKCTAAYHDKKHLSGKVAVVVKITKKVNIISSSMVKNG